MPNDQIPITNQCPMTNAQRKRDCWELIIAAWSLIGHWSLVIGVSAALLVTPTAAQTTKPTDLAATPNQVTGDEITPAQQESVRRGLAWLATHQNRDGGYGAMNGPVSHAGITALAGLAFMQAG